MAVIRFKDVALRWIEKKHPRSGQIRKMVMHQAQQAFDRRIENGIAVVQAARENKHNVFLEALLGAPPSDDKK